MYPYVAGGRLTLQLLRHEMRSLHLELVANRLVAWTSGNTSARKPGSGLVVMRSGRVRYSDLQPQCLVTMN